jgi:hypothetical protein
MNFSLAGKNKKKFFFQCDTTFFQTIPLRSNAIPLFSNDTTFFDTTDTTLHFPLKISKFKQTTFFQWTIENFKQKISIQKIPLKKVVCLNFGFFGEKCKVVSAVSKKVVSFEKSGIALERSGIV